MKFKWPTWLVRKKPDEAAKLPVEPPKSSPRRKGWNDVPLATQQEPGSPFVVAKPTPGVVPKDAKSAIMAMDNSLGVGTTQPELLFGFANSMFSAFVEGQAFLGYPLLASMLQRSEYRVPCETIAAEMTRNWGIVTYIGEDDQTPAQKKVAAKKKKDIEDELERLNTKALVRKALEMAEGYGKAQIYIDTGATDKPEELTKPLIMDAAKIGKGGLKGLVVIEPIWTYPNRYNTTDPLKSDYYRPESWFVLGKTVHHTRLLTIIPHPVSDILKPAYAFGGLSLTQMMHPYVDNWLNTRQSVNDIIQNFSTSVLKTNLSTLIQNDELLKRAQTFVATRTNQGLFLVNREDDEEFQNVSTPLSSLDKLQAQAQEHMAAPCRIPFIKLFGITPSGLNASSDGELQAFYESLSSDQEAHATPVLDAIIKLAQLNVWGRIDPNIGWKWNPIKHLDKVEEATADKMKAETDSIRINDGIIDPAEVRSVIANDETNPYHGIDPNDVPEPPENEDLGIGTPFNKQEKA